MQGIASHLDLPRHSLTSRHQAFLLKLFRASKNPTQVAKLLRKASFSQIQALSEIALNLLQDNIPLQSKIFKQLLPYRRIVRQLANQRTSPAQKKRLLIRTNSVQTGGVLPFLIPFLAPIAGTLAAAGIEQLL